MKRFLTGALLFLTVAYSVTILLKALSCYTAATTIKATTYPDKDKLFDQAIMSIAETYNSKYNPYDLDFSEYFAPIYLPGSIADFEKYINDRLYMIGRDNRVTGALVNNMTTVVYNHAAFVSGLALKCYSNKFGYEDKLVFYFEYSNREKTNLTRIGVALVNGSGL
ncbi:hypothetical protein QA634_33695 [Methylobacterium sp. CB376]|uniref:hypothetical protein n=1 Tax=unclassified Methylobacterium TaxID=2615210 RepID=UPI00123736D3|nr:MULTISPECIES: hypothetical protein [Methylobacterium]WFT80077.1 hypothetical protein QA634_33695 [Methylobacterium nodulans]